MIDLEDKTTKNIISEYEELLKLVNFLYRNSKCEITQTAIRLYNARIGEKYFPFKRKNDERKRILPKYDESEVNKGIDDAIKAEQED